MNKYLIMLLVCSSVSLYGMETEKEKDEGAFNLDDASWEERIRWVDKQYLQCTEEEKKMCDEPMKYFVLMAEEWGAFGKEDLVPNEWKGIKYTDQFVKHLEEIETKLEKSGKKEMLSHVREIRAYTLLLAKHREAGKEDEMPIFQHGK